MKNVLKPLAKSVLIPLGSTAAAAKDAAIPKKMFGSGTATLIISNEEMNNIIKTVKSLEESSLLKTITKQLGGFLLQEQKNKKEDFPECH